MMKKQPSLSRLLCLLSSLLCALLLSCDIKDNEVLPADHFVRIYETGEFERSYVPIDVRPTRDGGYLILAGARVSDSDFPAAYLMKVDEEGKLQWEHLSDKFVHPVSELLSDNETGGSPDVYSFVAMDKQQLGTHIITINVAAEELPVPSSMAYFSAYSYPLAANAVPGGFAILFWHREDKNKMQLSRVRGASEVWTKKYDIYEDVEAQIMSHLTRQRQPLLPFKVGAISDGELYFNGFHNFTLSLNFVSGINGELRGVVNGTRYASGISQVAVLDQGRFALSRYQESGENLFTPAVELATREIRSMKDLPGHELPELNPYARVNIRQEMLRQQRLTLYGSDTRNGQIALFAYNADGVLLGTQYLGAGNRFEAASIRVGPQGNLLVLGRVFMAGRFPRLCLFKLSQQQVNSLLSQ